MFEKVERESREYRKAGCKQNDLALKDARERETADGVLTLPQQRQHAYDHQHGQGGAQAVLGEVREEQEEGERDAEPDEGHTVRM